jgi:hypothetical protein
VYIGVCEKSDKNDDLLQRYYREFEDITNKYKSTKVSKIYE